MHEGLPRLARFLLRFVGDERRTDVLGDLAEVHATRVAKMGPGRARFATCLDALLVAGAFLFMRVGERREGRGIMPFEALRFDARIAVRGLARNPTFTAVSALTIAVGMAAVTSVLAISNALLIRPPAIVEPDRVRAIWEFRDENVRESMEGRLLRYERYEEYEERTTDVLAGLAGHAYATVALGGDDGATVVNGFHTSGNYFDVLGVAPGRGRHYSSDDEASIVLSDRLWRSRYGADLDVVGRVVMVDSQPFTVVGIAPPDFVGTMTGFTGDVWIPWNAYVRLTALDEDDRYVVPLARLADGVPATLAEERISAVAREIEPLASSTDITGARLDNLQWRTDLKSTLEIAMIAMIATAALLLLVACANIAGMTMARAHDRRREVAVRLAVGASRGRLVGQMLLESVLVAFGGGSLGVLLAFAATGVLSSIEVPLNATVTIDATPDPAILVISFVVAAVAGVLFGLGPSLRSARVDLTTSLKDGAPGRVRGHWRNASVVGQLAAGTVLLVTAGLFLRSFQEAINVPLGFDPEGLSVASMSLGTLGYSRQEGEAFYAELLNRVRALPGVEGAGLGSFVLLGGANASNEGRAIDGPNAGNPVQIGYNIVDPGYLEATGLQLVAGRFVTEGDTREGRRVAVVNERLADRLWPGESALGRTFRIGATEHDVVGVVRNGVYVLLVEEPRAFAYFLAGQRYSGGQSLHVRYAGPPPELHAEVRRTVAAIDPNVPVSALRTMDEVISSNGFMVQFVAVLTTIFAAAGLLLGAVGVYGLLSVQVARRARELGVRIALGARPPDIVLMVARRGVGTATLGCALGIGIAMGAGRLLDSVLYAVSPFDVSVFVLVPLTLIVAATLASVFPARRAARVDPMTPLKGE